MSTKIRASQEITFLTWCRNPLSTSKSKQVFVTLRCQKYRTCDGALVLPVRLPGTRTIPPIGRLAPSPVKKQLDQPRPSDDAANFKRTWNPPAENNSSSQHNLQSIGSRTPSAVRFAMRRTSLTTTTLSPLARVLNGQYFCLDGATSVTVSDNPGQHTVRCPRSCTRSSAQLRNHPHNDDPRLGGPTALASTGECT